MTLVRLVASDGSSIELWVPVGSDRVMDVSGPGPWLFKARWESSLYHGELLLKGGQLLLQWNLIGGEEIDETPIPDLERVTLIVGRTFRLRSAVTQQAKEFRVVDLYEDGVGGQQGRAMR